MYYFQAMTNPKVRGKEVVCLLALPSFVLHRLKIGYATRIVYG